MRASHLLGLALVYFVCQLMTQSLAAQEAGSPPVEVEYRPEVVYGAGGDHKLRLHLALPKGGAEKRPGLLFIHGGSDEWRSRS